MSESIAIEKELKIITMKEIWNMLFPKIANAIKTNTEMKINMGLVESIDGAGIQLILYLYFLSREFPDNIIIADTPEKIMNKLNELGFSLDKSEVKQ